MAGAACTDGITGITRAITPVSIVAISGMTVATLVETSAKSGDKTVGACDANFVTTGAMFVVIFDKTSNRRAKKDRDAKNVSSIERAESPAVP
jgi:hypothetical protein